VRKDWFIAKFTMDSDMMRFVNIVCCFFQSLAEHDTLSYSLLQVLL
jgi:hypothetical protein